MLRRLERVLTGVSTERPPMDLRARAIDSVWVASFQSLQRSPESSPRRIPVVAATTNAGCRRRWPVASRNGLVASSVWSGCRRGFSLFDP